VTSPGCSANETKQNRALVAARFGFDLFIIERTMPPLDSMEATTSTKLPTISTRPIANTGNQPTMKPTHRQTSPANQMDRNTRVTEAPRPRYGFRGKHEQKYRTASNIKAGLDLSFFVVCGSYIRSIALAASLCCHTVFQGAGATAYQRDV